MKLPFEFSDWQYAAFWTLVAAIVTVLVLCCMGCGFDRSAHQPPGDELPAPKLTREAVQSALEQGHGLARLWAKEHSVRVEHALPQFRLCADEDALIRIANAEKLPAQRVVAKLEGKRMWGCTNLSTGVVYLDEHAELDTIYHECGHWYLNLDCDGADAFAEWALDQRVKKFPVLDK